MPIIDPPYGCQKYNINRLCRFDRRAIDRKRDGCPRMTDRDYLASQDVRCLHNLCRYTKSIYIFKDLQCGN